VNPFALCRSGTGGKVQRDLADDFAAQIDVGNADDPDLTAGRNSDLLGESRLEAAGEEDLDPVEVVDLQRTIIINDADLNSATLGCARKGVGSANDHIDAAEDFRTASVNYLGRGRENIEADGSEAGSSAAQQQKSEKSCEQGLTTRFQIHIFLR